MADLDIGMEKAVLKKLLRVSKKDPVHCAVGVSKGMGVILLDKIKPSKTLSKDLEKKFADIKNPRWGTASVDVEEDPKLVILILNKPAPGLARALKKSLKPAGYSKVEIRDEEGNVAETEGDEEEEQAEAGAAPTSQAPAEEQPQAAAQRPPQEETAAAPDHAAAAEEQTQAAAPPAQQEDPAALTKELTDLIKQVVAAIGADPSRGATLKGLAAGATLARTLAMVGTFRSADHDTPVILMGYLNPIASYGPARFCADAAAAGVDGLIVVDLPPEEADMLAPHAAQHGLDIIRLVAPTTTPARLPYVLNGSSGFVYYISIAGITGTASATRASLEAAMPALRAATDLPVAIGFGIRTPAQAAEATRISDAAVVASVLIDTLLGTLDAQGRAQAHTVDAVLDQVRALAGAVRTARLVPA